MPGEAYVTEGNSNDGTRWLAYSMAGIAVIALIAAVIDTPLGDWSRSNQFFGVLLVIFALAFGYAGVRGSFNLLGRWSAKTSMAFSILGVLVAVLLTASAFLSGPWGVDSILTLGVGLALLLMFAISVVMARKKMQAN